MKPVFPADIGSLDCVWLTRILLQSGQLQSGGVAGFSCEEMDGGYTSTVYRLLLSYESLLGVAPESAVIKWLYWILTHRAYLYLQTWMTCFAKSMPITLEFLIVWTPLFSSTPTYVSGLVESLHRS